MDRQPRVLDRDENHDLERISCPIRPNDEPAVWILSCVLDGEHMVNGVADVVVGNAMLASRRVNLHERLVYYENRFTPRVR